jgi:O-antigen/teichoic acid export membrane protein
VTSSVGRLGHVAAVGAAAVGVSQAIKVGTQVLSVAILARLLTPADFGTVALITPVTALVSMFQDLGMQQAIVQRQEVSQEHLTRAFWFTVLLGLICAGIMAAAAPGVAAFFSDHRLIILTIATTPSLLFAAMGSVPTAILNRGMRFKMLAMVDVASALTTFVAAIVSAWLGAQYWSLVIGTLVGSIVTLFGVWWTSEWKPGRPSLQLPDRGMLGFGANLTGFSLMSFLARNLDKVLIGRFVGSIALGYYDRAYKLLLFPMANVNAPLARIAIPLLSRIQGDKPRLRDAFLRIASQVGLITIPGMAALVATSEQTVNLVFGSTWHPIVPIFAWLGLAGLVQPITFAVGWLLIAQGRTATMFKWGLYSSATAVISFVIGLHWGAVGVACVYALSDYAVRLPMLYFMVQRVGPVTALDLVRLQAPLLVAAGLTALISNKVLRERYGVDGMYLIAATILLSYGLAAAIMASLPRSRAVLQETFSLFRQLGRKVRSA